MVRISRNWEISYSDQTHIYTYTAFQEDLKYSDFFRDHLLQPQHIGDVRREFIFYGLEMGLEKGSFEPSNIDLHNRAEFTRYESEHC